jgi:hypothetical protein
VHHLNSPPLKRPSLLQWKSGLIRGLASHEGDNIQNVASHEGDNIQNVASHEGDNIQNVVVLYYQSASQIWRHKRSRHLREVVSLEGDNIVVFYYIAASQIWPHKRSNLIREGLLYTFLKWWCQFYQPYLNKNSFVLYRK